MPRHQKQQVKAQHARKIKQQEQVQQQDVVHTGTLTMKFAHIF